ncbi:hypothetical protein [Candidatus Hepatobacter penaei]|uniref:hypothetical protein n=1 Tax=Candidatus Hepatobacter penaei TaxID=1274402 RepID=UPI0012DFEED8|nr:hypothetical protein [Candidatus Hepatobacter penaei]
MKTTRYLGWMVGAFLLSTSGLYGSSQGTQHVMPALNKAFATKVHALGRMHGRTEGHADMIGAAAAGARHALRTGEKAAPHMMAAMRHTASDFAQNAQHVHHMFLKEAQHGWDVAQRKASHFYDKTQRQAQHTGKKLYSAAQHEVGKLAGQVHHGVSHGLHEVDKTLKAAIKKLPHPHKKSLFRALGREIHKAERGVVREVHDIEEDI